MFSQTLDTDTTHHPDRLVLGTTVHTMSEIDHSRTLRGSERWSYHFHLSLVNGREISAFVSFSRFSGLGSPPPPTSIQADQLQGRIEDQLVHSHVVHFAMSVPPDTTEDGKAPIPPTSTGQYHSTSAMDSKHLDRLRQAVEANTYMDSFIHQSHVDMLSNGGIPAPDTLIPGDISVSTHGPLSLKYGDLASVVRLQDRDGQDVYHVIVRAKDGSYGFELDLIPGRAPIHYQTNGISELDPGSDGSGTSYSFFSHCKVFGTVDFGNSQVAVDSKHSNGWYERASAECMRKWDDRTTTRTEASWTRASLQLSNGWDLKIHSIWDVDIFDGGAALRDKKVILISPDGSCIVPEEFTLNTLETWSSMSTLNEYGTKWRLSIPELEVDLSIAASFSQQEFGTICAGRGYWKGRVAITGTMGTEQVDGSGFVEIQPAQVITNLEKHLKRAALLTTLEVSRIYPERLIDPEHAMKTLGFDTAYYLDSDSVTGDPLRYMQNVPLDVLYQNIFAPVRHLMNGTGKSWRCYMSMLSIAVLGADPEPYRPFLAAVELVHTGTLIIDDILDESPIRRGVPAVHTVWGIAPAINAGELAYFAFHTAVQSIPDLSPEKKLAVLEIFFETMRFSLSGQALDIAGQQLSLLDDIVAGRTDPSALEKSVLAVHRLKTAVAASNIGRMAAVLAGASRTQARALSAHWERVGIAFQIIDDVYDIRRGSQAQNQKEGQRMIQRHPLKRRGDDIRSGKISVPIAKAGQMMPLSEAKWIWDTVLRKPGEDDVTTQKVIDKLEAYGVVDACVEDAQKMINDSWVTLEKHLTDSQAKIFVHAVCRYMGEYHSI